uniref:Jacalin-type lectin domain-containing protein n=1 Tax=Proboscia inermis TaxID=420281 RepID=A0A6T8HJV6_9STRA|mmetsp:Transcript_20890/g.21211  ORF Transcript_20890/g.21211 Transcript_20890/m.21211 type:complete len:205 (+) Transcript_20890:82-696(+)|eukprot:CAMPEP_0171324386 /NCGR_PEP_ID=MMETSP0816-20121228/116153_1 /TAXON_ID=420281 /ORGANISM="Proboscia inermis, Strain CCAP1064/1" /LENGTH=204 /DNA_ID=CAMNT_0011823303 /DNA_START=618 /DNA_END=1232 /DNA_ORIENTATION=-
MKSPALYCFAVVALAINTANVQGFLSPQPTSASFFGLKSKISLKSRTAVFSDVKESNEAESESETDNALGLKHFQLEEMEDKDSCATDIFLEENGNVVVGDGDGPISIKSTGTWSQEEDGSFLMSIIRTFGGGLEATKEWDLGEFTFDVERTYIGQIAQVGNKLAMTGSLWANDPFHGDTEVGFFNMIDSTEEGFKPEGRKLTS